MISKAGLSRSQPAAELRAYMQRAGQNGRRENALSGIGRSSEAPYGCYLPVLTRFGTWRRPSPLKALVNCSGKYSGEAPRLAQLRSSVTKFTHDTFMRTPLLPQPAVKALQCNPCDHYRHAKRKRRHVASSEGIEFERAFARAQIESALLGGESAGIGPSHRRNKQRRAQR